MPGVEEVSIDVQDVDYEWFRDVAAYLDRDCDRYYLPRESAERMGEIDEETGNFFLIDGQVEAKAEEIEVGGRRLPVWSVGCSELVSRPSGNNPT